MKRLGRLISLLTASAMTVSAFAGTPAGAYIDHTADLPENCFYLAVEDRNSIFDGRRIITQCDAGEYVEIALYANEVPVLSDLSLSIRGDSSFNITRYRNNYFREASFETEDDREYQYSFSMGRNVSIPNDEILAWLDVELPYSVGMYTFSVTVEDAREQNGDPVPWRTVDLEIKIDGGGYVVSSYTTPYSTTAGTTISTTSSGSATTPSTTSSSKTTTSASTTTSTTRTTAPPVTMSSTTTTASSIVEITETNTELITFDTELTTTTTTTEETTVTISETSAETTAAASSEETTVSTSASSDTKPYYAKNATIQILPVPDSQDYTVESLISENRIYADYGDEIVLGLYPEGIDATSGYLLYWDCSDVDFIGAVDYPTGSTLSPTFNARYANKADSFGQKYLSAVAAASSKCELMQNEPLVVFRISVPQKDDSRGSRYGDYVAFSITETNCRVEMVDSNGFTTVKTRYSSFLDENERDVLSQIIPTRIMVKDILVTTSYSMSYGGGPGTESNTTESSGTTDSIWTEATTTSFSDTTDSESAETTTTSELPASPGANVTSTTASAEANPTETDLPQTGVGSPAGLLTVCGSLTLIAAGAYVLQHTKRRDEEAE